MNWKTLGLVGAVVLALSAIACEEKTTNVVQPNGTAQGISVNGSGSAFGEPDVALVSLGVNVTATTVGAARTQASDAMNKMIESLKAGGVAEEDIQTTTFSVQPQYNYPPNGQPVLTGFTVDNRVTVKIRTIDDTGKLIDEALAAGGDAARVDNLSFTIDDPSTVEAEARGMAMDEAKAKAGTLAEKAGVTVGDPISISESFSPRPFEFNGAELANLAADQSSTPIQTGEMEIQVEVQVVYGMESN